MRKEILFLFSQKKSVLHQASNPCCVCDFAGGGGRGEEVRAHEICKGWVGLGTRGGAFMEKEKNIFFIL